MVITQIKQVSIYVTNQDQALDFYTKKLGFTVVTDVPWKDPLQAEDSPAADQGDKRWIELKLPGEETMLVLFATDEQSVGIGTFSNIMFASSNLEETYRLMQERGVEVVEAPKKESWGSYLTFKDPDGNTFLVSGADA